MKKNIFTRIATIVCLLTGMAGVFGQSAQAETIPAANDPGLNKESHGVKTIYSNYYGKRTDLQYDSWGATQTTIKSTENNSNGQEMIEFSSFDNQVIAFYDENVEPNVKIETSSISHINIDIYLSEKIDGLYIKLYAPLSEAVYGYTASKNDTDGELSSGVWHTLSIPLSEFRSVSYEGNELKQINAIELTVVDGTGKPVEGSATAYLDNIFFYKNADVSTTLLEAAPIPKYQRSNIKNFYSTEYGTDISIEYLQWGSSTLNSTAKDENQKDILKFSTFGWMAMQYNPTNQVLNIEGKDYLHLEVYPETAILFAVELILYEDRIEGVDESQKVKTNFYSLTANSWNSIDINLSDFYEKTGGNKYISVINLSSNSELTTVYMDHVYFYDSKQTVVEGTPDFTAYLPPVRNADDVISLFGDSYTDVSSKRKVDFLATSSHQTTVPQPTSIANREVMALIDMNHCPIQILDENKDVSGMDFFHIDIYSPVAIRSFNVKLNGNEKTHDINLPLEAGKWNRFDIDLSTLKLGENRSILTRLDYVWPENGGSNTLFVDNIYFYNKQDHFDPTPISTFNNQLGRGVNIGATFEQEADYLWDDYYIQKIKEKGFKHVRLPVRWDNFPTSDYRSLKEAPYNIKPEFLTEIQTVVDKLLAADLKVILNIHHYDPLMDLTGDTQEAEIKRFLALWGQLSEYFQNYDERLIFEILNEPRDAMDSKWNRVFKDAIGVIRKENKFGNANNQNRVLMVGTTDWGTINGLEGSNALILPEDDKRLIVTIHYYNPLPFTHQGASWVKPGYPIGLRWNDTQKERDAVTADFEKIKKFSEDNKNVPIHIGEFGVHFEADIDSRLLWTNHIARTIDKHGFSSAYWHLTSSIYNKSKGDFPYLPDALLTHSMPAKVSGIEYREKESVYDIKNPGGKSWSGHGYVGELNSVKDALTVQIENGGEYTYSVQALLRGLPIENNATYEVSFTAMSTGEGDSYYTYVGSEGEGHTPYGNFSFAPGNEEQVFSYAFTMHYDTDAEARMAFDLGKGSPATITLKDITVKKVVEVIPQAPVPSKNAEETTCIFSSKYTGDLYIPAANDLAMNMQEQKIILFSDFDSREISFATTSPGDKKMLHLEVYPGSWFDVKIAVTGNGDTSAEESYTLKPHEWNGIDIDLTGFLSQTGGKLKSIQLSGGTGEERRIYLDHIYLYQKTVVKPDPEDPDPEDPDPEDESAPLWPASTPTLLQENVISVFSNVYENIYSSFESLEGQDTKVETITVKGIPVWKLTNTNILAVNIKLQDVSSMEFLHLDVWSPNAGTLKVYLSDGISETELTALSIPKENWLTSKLTLPDWSIVKYIRFESDTKGTFYLDNLYFSKSPATGNEEINADAIVCQVSNSRLTVEATDPVVVIEIIDITGRLISRESPMTNIATVDIHSISKGVYIAQVVCTNGNRETFKFVKK